MFDDEDAFRSGFDPEMAGDPDDLDPMPEPTDADEQIGYLDRHAQAEPQSETDEDDELEAEHEE